LGNRKSHNRRKEWALPAAAGLAIATLLALLLMASRTASASDDGIACNNDVPSGWACVPLVERDFSGPSATDPAHGEVLFALDGPDTLRVAIRALNAADQVSGNGRLCLDDDDLPFTDGTTGNGNLPHDCSGGNAARSAVDGSSGIPSAAGGEPDEAELQYEVRVVNISTDGAASGLAYAEFNNIEGYSYFVYRVNIGGEQTQAFFEQPSAPVSIPTPTPVEEANSTPTPTADPTHTATPEPTPTPTTDPTPTPEPTPTPTPEVTPVPTDGPTASPAPTPSLVTAQTPTPSPRPKQPGLRALPTPTPKPTAEPSMAPAALLLAPMEPPAFGPDVEDFGPAAPAQPSTDEGSGQAETPSEPQTSHQATILFFGAIGLAWLGTAAVVWAGFRATTKLDEMDLPF
jgi:cell division septation protein DedD